MLKEKYLNNYSNIHNYFDFLSVHNISDIRIRNSRIGIQHIIELYVELKKTPEEIIEELPSLSLEQVYATILFYLQNSKIREYYKEHIEFSKEAREKQAKDPKHQEFKKKLYRRIYEKKNQN